MISTIMGSSMTLRKNDDRAVIQKKKRKRIKGEKYETKSQVTGGNYDV